MTTFNLTKDQLAKLLPGNPKINEWFDSLSKLLPQYDINTPNRIAAFMAQCSHESAQFRLLKENLNYRWDILRRVFPRYFLTDDLAKQYASKSNKQEAIANRVYGNRMGNGPESSGDGFRYCGRGLIQLTGKSNYEAFAKSINKTLEETPAYLETFDGAVHGACWYWQRNNLNNWADIGNIKELTRKINGGYNGLDDRIKHYNHAISVLGA